MALPSTSERSALQVGSSVPSNGGFCEWTTRPEAHEDSPVRADMATHETNHWRMIHDLD